MNNDIMQQSYTDLYDQCYWLKVLLIKKLIKISSPMIENIVVAGYFSVGRILLVYSWEHPSKDPLSFTHITSDSNFCKNFTKVFNCIAKYFSLVPCKGFVRKQSFINCTKRSATQCTLRAHSQSALKENPLVRVDILHQDQSSK